MISNIEECYYWYQIDYSWLIMGLERYNTVNSPVNQWISFDQLSIYPSSFKKNFFLKIVSMIGKYFI